MRSGVTVRPAIPDDWPQIEEVFVEAGNSAWQHIFSPEGLLELRANERWKESIESLEFDTAAFVAEFQGRVIGFAVVRPFGEPGVGEIDAFYTHPRNWGMGAGQLMMETCLERLREAGMDRAVLWTEERNFRPRRFYELVGFELDGHSRTRVVRGEQITELRYAICL